MALSRRLITTMKETAVAANNNFNPRGKEIAEIADRVIALLQVARTTKTGSQVVTEIRCDINKIRQLIQDIGAENQAVLSSRKNIIRVPVKTKVVNGPNAIVISEKDWQCLQSPQPKETKDALNQSLNKWADFLATTGGQVVFILELSSRVAKAPAVEAKEQQKPKIVVPISTKPKPKASPIIIPPPAEDESTLAELRELTLAATPRAASRPALPNPEEAAALGAGSTYRL